MRASALSQHCTGRHRGARLANVYRAGPRLRGWSLSRYTPGRLIASSRRNPQRVRSRDGTVGNCACPGTRRSSCHPPVWMVSAQTLWKLCRDTGQAIRPPFLARIDSHVFAQRLTPVNLRRRPSFPWTGRTRGGGCLLVSPPGPTPAGPGMS